MTSAVKFWLSKVNRICRQIGPKLILFPQKIKMLTPNIPKNQWEKLNRFHYCQISKFWFFWKGPTLDGSSTRTTKSPIRGKHWVLIGCRALLGSVRPFMLKLLIFCNFRLNIFNTIVYPNTGYNGRCFLIMLIACMFFLVFSFLAKGQLIPKCLFGVFKSTKKPTKFLYGFLP